VGNSAFTFPVGSTTRYARLAISAPTNSTAEFTAEYTSSAYSDINTIESSLKRVSSLEYWQLDRNVGSSPGDDVFVTLYWDSGTFSKIDNLSDLRVAHWTGAIWEDKGNGATTGDTSAGTIRSGTAFDNFSPITFGGSESGTNPLPVELTSFELEQQGNAPYLKWVTASEINNDRFEIERSLNGANWKNIAKIKGQGNTNQLTSYAYLDEEATHLGHTLLYYRLKQVDFNGDFVYTKIKSIEINSILGFDIKVFPNPSHGATHISYYLPKQSKVLAEIFNIKGELIKIIVNDRQESGHYDYKFNAIDEGFGKGIYLLKLSIDGEVSYKRFSELN
jgi:hypothetical protein